MADSHQHLHFVQSLETLQGGGLGQAALALHLEFLRAAVPSRLVSTTGGETTSPHPGVTLCLRNGPPRAFWSAELQRMRSYLVKTASVVHGHGFYVGTNSIIGGEALRQHKALVHHVHGFFEPWIQARSRGKKQIAHWLFENSNFREARLWRALTSKEADHVRSPSC